MPKRVLDNQNKTVFKSNYEKENTQKKTEPINKLVEISTKINKLTIYICINLLNP
jgi:hypothetical protein